MEQAEIKKAQWILGIFLIAHFVFIFWHPGYMWGIDFLAYYSGWDWLGIFIVGSVLFLAIPYSDQILPLIASLTTGVRAIILILMVSTAFSVFKVPTHLLGDGALFLRELATLSDTQEWVRPNRSPIVYKFIQALFHSPHITSLLAYQIYSWASGVLYVGVALFFSKKIGRDQTETALLLGILLSTGFMIQFFGYVENYALLFPAILIFLLLGLLTLENKCHIFIFSAFTSILFPIHFVTFSFLPAYSLVIYFAMIQSQSAKRSTHALKFAFCLLITMSVSFGLFIAVNFDILSYLLNHKQSHILPLFDTQSYSVFAPIHLLDILNLTVLLCPFFCLTFCFLIPRPTINKTPQNIFLINATLFPFFMISIANPEIGFFRDWDALSFFALPLTVLLFFLLRDSCTNTKTLAQVGILFITGSMFHTLIWIGINTNQNKSIHRYESILKSQTVPPIPAAFSWETLAIYYRQQNKFQQSTAAYEQAYQNDPQNARYLNALGISHQNNNDTKRALAYFKKALAQNPKLPEVQANMGDIFFQHNQYDSAKYYFEQAFKNGLMDQSLYDNLGKTYQALGDEEQANKWLSLAKEKKR